MKYIGDALQYSVTTKLVKKAIPQSDISVFSPDIAELELSSNEIRAPRLINSNFTGALLLKQILRQSTPNRTPASQQEKIDETTIEKHIQNSPARNAKTRLRNSLNEQLNSPTFNKYIASPLLKRKFSFDAAILGGHTICGNIDYFSIQYNNLRSTVPKGAIVTAPISLSALSIQNCKKTAQAKIRRIEESLRRLDHIFVRGTHSLEIIKNELNITEKVTIALDSGFGIKSFYPKITIRKHKKEKTKIVIVPRKEYFEHYGSKLDLYKQYIDALLGLIEASFEKFDADIYLALQTADYQIGIQQSGIKDIIEQLKKTNPTHLNRLKIFKPNSIIDAFTLFSSANAILTSYMHAGIMGLSAGIPSIFIAPLSDTKVLDNLSTIGLNPNHFFIDMYDQTTLTSNNLIEKTTQIIDNQSSYQNLIENAVNKALQTIELPTKTLAAL